VKFCSACDARLKKEDNENVCPKCGHTEKFSSNKIEEKQRKEQKKRILKKEYDQHESERHEKELQEIEKRKQLYRLAPIPDLELALTEIAKFKNKPIRNNQNKIIQEFTKSIKNGYNKIIISAPTGAGKSWVAIALSLAYKSSVILTSTKYLQKQYTDDFGEGNYFLSEVKGKNEFLCERNFKLTDCTKGYCSNCDFKPSSSDFEFKADTKGKVSEMLLNKKNEKSCSYFEQIYKGKLSSFSIYNYAAYLSQLKQEDASEDDANKGLPNKKLLVCDEMHNYEEQLANALAIELKPDLDSILLDNYSIVVDAIDVLEHIEKLLNAYAKIIGDYYECSQHTLDLLSPKHLKQHIQLCPTHTDLRISRDCNFCKNVRRYIESKSYLDCKTCIKCHRDHHRFNHENKTRLDQYKNELEFVHFGLNEYPDNYIVSKNNRGNVIIEPKNSNWMSRKLFEKFDVMVFMSATANKRLFCKETGFREDEIDFISVESDIPLENRSIEFKNVGNLTGKSKDWPWKKIISEIEQILSENNDRHGIIILTSYLQMHEIINGLDESFHKRLIPTHTIDDKHVTDEICPECSYPYKNIREALNSHRSGTILNSVIISVSSALGMGVDLPYDQSRFQIILKIPFPSLGDERMKYISESDGARYSLKTLFTLIQNCGRSIRANDDCAKTYILDSTVNNFFTQKPTVWSETPKWFKDAIKPNLTHNN